jgi:pimeloyl-ACP methyl ester carboxylesterase
MMPLSIWIAIFVILGLILIYFIVGGIAALSLTKIDEHPHYDQTPGSFGLDYQTLCITSRNDKKKLSAWYIHNPQASRSLVMVHGRNASKQDAISGKLPALAAALQRQGYAIMMIDLRGHGESEGKRYTWGEHERRDVLGAVDFLLEEGFQPGKIGVVGISLGGAAAIGAAAEEKAIGVVVVESTFADLINLVEPKWVTKSSLPIFFMTGVYLMWRLFYGFDLKEVRPLEDLKKVPPRPILLMHSKDDEKIDVEQAYKLANGVPSAKLVIFDSCEHAELYRDEPEKYLDVIIPFLQANWGD